MCHVTCTHAYQTHTHVSDTHVCPSAAVSWSMQKTGLLSCPACPGTHSPPAAAAASPDDLDRPSMLQNHPGWGPGAFLWGPTGLGSRSGALLRAPTSCHDGPRGPKIVPRRAQMAPRRPKRPPRRPRALHEASQDSSKRPKSSIFLRFFVDFRMIAFSGFPVPKTAWEASQTGPRQPKRPP